MLAAIGAKKIEDLFDEIPKELRIESLAGIPDALNEMHTGKLMMARAAQDGTPLNFIGAGAYEHHIPAAVWAVTTRGEFYSAYTPYQAEASHPTPDPLTAPSPAATPSIAPLFPPVASFQTEQIYICNRDGYDLKPLTFREGLIYFYYEWAPDSSALVALACKEDEWNVRERQYKSPAGRPRLLMPDGAERLLDDGLTDALPVWSPDASKVATAFETDVAIYDVGGNTPTQGRIPLGDQLISASLAYEEKSGAKKANANADAAASQATASSAAPPSLNPIVSFEWPSPETLYFKTAYVRVMPSETINTFQRWHQLNLSAQAAILK
jgi:hypothetical protein